MMYFAIFDHKSHFKPVKNSCRRVSVLAKMYAYSLELYEI